MLQLWIIKLICKFFLLTIYFILYKVRSSDKSSVIFLFHQSLSLLASRPCLIFEKHHYQSQSSPESLISFMLLLLLLLKLWHCLLTSAYLGFAKQCFGLWITGHFTLCFPPYLLWSMSLSISYFQDRSQGSQSSKGLNS